MMNGIQILLKVACVLDYHHQLEDFLSMHPLEELLSDDLGQDINSIVTQFGIGFLI